MKTITRRQQQVLFYTFLAIIVVVSVLLCIPIYKHYVLSAKVDNIETILSFFGVEMVGCFAFGWRSLFAQKEDQDEQGRGTQIIWQATEQIPLRNQTEKLSKQDLASTSSDNIGQEISIIRTSRDIIIENSKHSEFEAYNREFYKKLIAMIKQARQEIIIVGHGFDYAGGKNISRLYANQYLRAIANAGEHCNVLRIDFTDSAMESWLGWLKDLALYLPFNQRHTDSGVTVLRPKNRDAYFLEILRFQIGQTRITVGASSCSQHQFEALKTLFVLIWLSIARPLICAAVLLLMFLK